MDQARNHDLQERRRDRVGGLYGSIDYETHVGAVIQYSILDLSRIFEAFPENMQRSMLAIVSDYEHPLYPNDTFQDI